MTNTTKKKLVVGLKPYSTKFGGASASRRRYTTHYKKTTWKNFGMMSNGAVRRGASLRMPFGKLGPKATSCTISGRNTIRRRGSMAKKSKNHKTIWLAIQEGGSTGEWYPSTYDRK